MGILVLLQFCGGAAGISGTLVELYSLLKQMEEFPNVAFFKVKRRAKAKRESE